MSVHLHPKPQLKSPTELSCASLPAAFAVVTCTRMTDELKRLTVVGHEIMGVIEETGDAVSSIKKGDRVVLPFNIACGFCANCHRGDTHACLTMNPENPGAAYGYTGMGPYQGRQAEFVLVPHADFNCLKLPGTPGDDWEDSSPDSKSSHLKSLSPALIVRSA